MVTIKVRGEHLLRVVAGRYEMTWRGWLVVIERHRGVWSAHYAENQASDMPALPAVRTLTLSGAVAALQREAR